MSVDFRRSPRLIDYLPLAVRVVKILDTTPLAGPFAGRIIDVSIHGACLLMSQVMHNTVHVFHSTRNSSTAILQLCITLPPDLDECLLLARPIWMAQFEQGAIRAFKMGVEFIEDPVRGTMRGVHQAICVNQTQRVDGWLKHCCQPQQGSSLRN